MYSGFARFYDVLQGGTPEPFAAWIERRTAELGREALAGTPIACLGSSGKLMQRRLRQFLAGQLDT